VVTITAMTMKVMRSCAALALASLALGGCLRRLDLTPGELELLRDSDPELAELRVLPRRKLLSYYPQRDYESSIAVTRASVRVRGERRADERIVSRRTTGKIVAVEELSGMPLLWVNFDDKCTTSARECAHGFVLTELGRYSLVSVPEREGFAEPRNYRRNKLKRNRLKLMRQRSMVELNEVLGVARRVRRKVLTVDLQYRENKYQKTKKTRRRLKGV
jgi:hypothetical protein